MKKNKFSPNIEKNLVDYYWKIIPSDVPNKEVNCFNCQKEYCLVEAFLQIPNEGEKEYFFCCDYCCDKWWAKEIIIIPNALGHYFWETKPNQTPTCQNCWPAQSYWVKTSSNFRMFGKSKKWGECNNCGKGESFVVGELQFEWNNIRKGYYFCSVWCCKTWLRKNGGDNYLDDFHFSH